MPSKEENKQLEELSLKVFGKRYAWRKLRKRGLMAGQDGIAVRRMPLTVKQCFDYMNKTIEMRKAMAEEQNESRG